MITGIEHVGLAAMNTRRLKDFYVNLFGWEVVYKNEENPPTYFLKTKDGSMVEIYPATSEGCMKVCNCKQGLRHIALWTDDFEADAAKCYRAGCEIVEPASTNEKGVSKMFFYDLEGNLLHLISRPQKLGCDDVKESSLL